MMFGENTFEDIVRHQEQNYCIGCIFDFDQSKDIYTVTVKNKKTSFVYNTCVDCELYFNNDISKIPGQIKVYKDFELIYNGQTIDLKYIYKALISHKINKVIPTYLHRLHNKQNLYHHLQDNFNEDVLFIIQSFL